MRTLIVGAGVAGLTLAARLAQQGRPPTVVERAAGEQPGYAIGLYPLGSCVLHGLGCYDELLRRGLAIEQYRLADHRGRVLQEVGMARLTGEVGPLVMIGRAELLDLLERAAAGVAVRRGTTVAAVAPDGAGVDVTFSDGGSQRFDAVIACDGMRSGVRSLVFGEQPGYDASWTLFTWWAPRDADPAPAVPAATEYWGSGWFLGFYPVRDAVMCAAGAPAAVLGEVPAGDAGGFLRGLLGPVADQPAVGAALAAAGTPYAWEMRDVRAGAWVDGRIALCGDAAAGFLPTAGVGASNAMRAAAALADELSRAGPGTVPLALGLYEQRCRSVVERNQTDSRRLARVMFLGRPELRWVRDRFARRYPPERMLAQILHSTRTPF